MLYLLFQASINLCDDGLTVTFHSVHYTVYPVSKYFMPLSTLDNFYKNIVYYNYILGENKKDHEGSLSPFDNCLRKQILFNKMTLAKCRTL